MLPANTVQAEETGAWQCSSVHADLLLFPEDVKLFTAPANKVRITAVLSCHQCRKVQPLLHQLCLLTGSWLLSICSLWISGKQGAGLLCSVRSRGATSKSALKLWLHLITGVTALVSTPLARKWHCSWTDLSGRQLAAFICLCAGGEEGTCTQRNKKGNKQSARNLGFL